MDTCALQLNRHAALFRERNRIAELAAVVVACFAAAPALAQSDALRVLFLGNSYTYYNNLPQTVAAFALRDPAARGIQQESITVGGASLESLWEQGKSRRVIAEGQWNIVVLQEQSARPLEAPGQMQKYGRRFADRAKSNGADVVLFVTWPDRADQKSRQKIESVYRTLARETGATLAPVSSAWRITLERNANLTLYDADGHHPSGLGSYVAACTLYLVIAKSSKPCADVALVGFSTQDAALGREAAWQAVQESRRDPAITAP